MKEVTNKVLNIYKPVGKTPFEMIKELKNKFPELKSLKIGYAGRLDPMASGVLILLIEPETKKREYYQQLNKRYNFSVMFGIGTDSYDILGKITGKSVTKKSLEEKDIKNVTKYFIGTQIQRYPPYSSLKVNGKSLFWWARNNMLDKIEIPEKTIEIYSLSLNKLDTISVSELKNCIYYRITTIKGDFRQKEIMNCWKNYFISTKVKTFPVVDFSIYASSGAYIRKLAFDIGKKLNYPSMILNLERTSVGDYNIKDSLKI